MYQAELELENYLQINGEATLGELADLVGLRGSELTATVNRHPELTFDGSVVSVSYK